jgi:ArsR family transcriptional regulator, arsenate/arsenite/antimonite-responsive transcriptional repressor
VGDVFKALSDPTRRRILEILKSGDLSAGQIAEAFPIGKPAISHHLAQLKSADLVQAERDGQNIIYSLNTTVFQDLLTWIYALRGSEEAGYEER